MAEKKILGTSSQDKDSLYKGNLNFDIYNEIQDLKEIILQYVMIKEKRSLRKNFDTTIFCLVLFILVYSFLKNNVI